MTCDRMRDAQSAFGESDVCAKSGNRLRDVRAQNHFPQHPGGLVVEKLGMIKW